MLGERKFSIQFPGAETEKEGTPRAGTTEQNQEEINIYIGRASAYIHLTGRTRANAQQTSLETLQKGNWSLVWELLVLIPGNTASAQFHSGL